MRKIEVIIRQILWSFIKSLKPNNYNLVKYKSDLFYIESSLCGEGIWNLYKKGNKNNPTYRYVKEKELKVIFSFKQFLQNFKMAYSFQKQNWRSIDYKHKLGTRISYLSSENIYFP